MEHAAVQHGLHLPCCLSWVHICSQNLGQKMSEDFSWQNLGRSTWFCMCFWILWFLLLDVIRVNHRESSQRNHVYIYICIRMFDFWAPKNSFALTLSPSHIGQLCMWHSQDGPLLAAGPWGSSVALVLHLMPFESGRCWYENYIPKKTHARMRIWYSIPSYSATTGLSATFFASFFQPIQIQ